MIRAATFAVLLWTTAHAQPIARATANPGRAGCEQQVLFSGLERFLRCCANEI